MEGVRNRMEEGVDVRITEVNLNAVEDDIDFWVVKVKVEKEFYNYVDARNEVKQISGRTMEQDFLFDIVKKNLENATIRKITYECKSDECKPKADYTRYIGGSLGVSKPLIAGVTSGGYLSDNPGFGDLEVTADPGFSAGIEFITNRLSSREDLKKNFFVTAGLRFQYNSYTGKLNNYRFETEDQADAQNYLRQGSGINATEKLSVGTVEVPLGVAIRLRKKQKQTSELFVQARLLPSYFILTGTGSLDSDGTYDAIISEANWRILRDGAANPDQLSGQSSTSKFDAFLAGSSRSISASPETTVNGLGLGAQLSPTLIFHLGDGNPNWSLMLGLDLTYHLGSFIKFNGSKDILLRYPQDDDYSRNPDRGINNNVSLVEYYLSGMSVANVGFRIGLLRRLVSSL